MVNKKKKASVKNIKYNKSKVQKIKQNVIINLTAPKRRASSSRKSQQRPPSSMPKIVSTFTPIMPPPPPPSAPMAFPQQFMSAKSTNPFASMMSTQQQEQQASQARQQGNGLERTPEPEPAPEEETSTEEIAPASKPQDKTLKLEKYKFFLNPQFRKDVLAKQKQKQSEPVIVEEQREDFSDMPPLTEDVLLNALNENVPPKPQQVFESPESENVFVPRRQRNFMSMTELIEEREQEGRSIVPNISLPPIQRPIKDVTPQETAIVFKPRRPTREDIARIHERRVIQQTEKPVIQIEDKPSILETRDAPLRRAEAYDEEPQQQTETEAETDARKKYVNFLSSREDVITEEMNSAQRSLAYKKKLQDEMRKRNLPYQIDTGKRNDFGVKKYKPLTNAEMVQALMEDYDTQPTLKF